MVDKKADDDDDNAWLVGDDEEEHVVVVVVKARVDIVSVTEGPDGSTTAPLSSFLSSEIPDGSDADTTDGSEQLVDGLSGRS